MAEILISSRQIKRLKMVVVRFEMYWEAVEMFWKFGKISTKSLPLTVTDPAMKRYFMTPKRSH